MDIIQSLNWRYATKKFDTKKEVSKKDLDEIVEAFRLTASWFWLQPWHLVIVENKWIKEELLKYSYNQQQVTDCSKLLVLCYKKPSKDLVDSFLDDMCEKTWKKREDMKWYEDVINWFLWMMSDEQKSIWAQKQVYIALWNLLNTLAIKNIDSCPIEWFNPSKYDEVLNLNEKQIYSLVVLAIWYRDKDDKYSNYPKVRFKKEDITTFL